MKLILDSGEKPVRLIFAGLCHPEDEEGKKAVSQIRAFAKKELRENLVFLDGYSTEMGSMLTSGCDVWLNTPVVGFEACGTSGMKSALNGGLNFSTKDGWLYETDLNKIGWEIDEQFLSEDIYNTLEKEIIPQYYSGATPSDQWKTKMSQARHVAQNDFSATKMMRAYCEEMYAKLI
jgi:starch phosphorylase